MQPLGDSTNRFGGARLKHHYRTSGRLPQSLGVITYSGPTVSTWIPANNATVAYELFDCSWASAAAGDFHPRILRGWLLSSSWTCVSRSAVWTARFAPLGK